MAVETDILPPRYRGPQRIGRGAMGEIYRATDTTLGRAVAVKLLAQRYADNDDIRERFTREALAAARLSGASSIVTIFDVGEWNDRPFIVMEYLGGGSLAERLQREARQPTGEVLAWLEDAARALDAAHAAGVVHRDVKPANLLLDRDGNVHVADFGIASAAGMDSLTQTGTVLGTAGYLSPEQARGERATPASDRYALAVVAFELLTGSRPFQADSTAAEAAAHVHQPVPSVCERDRDLPCELDPVFARALAKRPEDRYPSAREFVAELRHALHEAEGRTEVVATAAKRPVRAQRGPVEGVRGNRAVPPAHRTFLWPLAALVALAAIGGGVAAALTSGGGTPATNAVTVKVTTTAAASTASAASSSSTQTQAQTTATDPHVLNDRGYALMQRGDYGNALPLLQQAVQGLRDASPGDPYVAYANYNLGYTLLQLGRCADAVPYLQAAARLEPARHEPKDALKRAKKC